MRPVDLHIWSQHFLSKTEPPLPWNHPDHLRDNERSIVASSVPQFQLGEGSDGNGLTARAAKSGGPQLASTLRAFIGEEQRHSALLGRFLQREGIPLLKTHWVDRIFRYARKLAGFELCMRVLAVAEVIAVPYYTALRAATGSPLLRELCKAILEDEAVHLVFQAECQASYGSRSRIADDLQFLLLGGTIVIVWRQHGEVLRAGGYTWRHFAIECAAELDRLHRRARDARRQQVVTRPALAPPSGC